MRKVILFNIVIILASSVYLNEFILTDDVFYSSLGHQLSNDQIESIIGTSKMMAWFDYSLSVVGYLLKIIIISALVYLVLYLNEKKATYSETIGIVSESFTIFLIPIILKILMLSFSSTSISLDDIQFFSVGSLIDVVNSDGMENWLIVILKTINIWEVIFIVLLAMQLKKYFDNDLRKSMSNVVFSYGGGLLVWIFFSIFITITLTPN